MVSLVSAVSLVVGCEGSSGGGDPVCGVAMLAGPTTLLTQFEVPNQTLGSPPQNLPERIVARVVAGPAVPAIVGRTDSMLVIGVEGTAPSGNPVGFGVLVVDRQERPRGVMLYEGDPVEGAPQLGVVSIGATSAPLIGVEVDPAKVEDPRCPFFPDSVRE